MHTCARDAYPNHFAAALSFPCGPGVVDADDIAVSVIQHSFRRFEDPRELRWVRGRLRADVDLHPYGVGVKLDLVAIADLQRRWDIRSAVVLPGIGAQTGEWQEEECARCERKQLSRAQQAARGDYWVLHNFSFLFGSGQVAFVFQGTSLLGAARSLVTTPDITQVLLTSVRANQPVPRRKLKRNLQLI